MKKIVRINDYVFYRVQSFYERFESDSRTTGLLGVSLFQVVLLFELIFVVARLSGYWQLISNNSKLIAASGVIALFLLYFVNTFRYTQSLCNSFPDKWGHHSQNQRRVYGFLVILAITSPFWIGLLRMK